MSEQFSTQMSQRLISQGKPCSQHYTGMHFCSETRVLPVQYASPSGYIYSPNVQNYALVLAKSKITPCLQEFRIGDLPQLAALPTRCTIHLRCHIFYSHFALYVQNGMSEEASASISARGTERTSSHRCAIQREDLYYSDQSGNLIRLGGYSKQSTVYFIFSYGGQTRLMG